MPLGWNEPPPPSAQLQLMYTLLLGLFLLILGLVVVAMVARQYTRAARRRPDSSKTEYVDAWKEYRLTDEELAPFAESDSDEPPAAS